MYWSWLASVTRLGSIDLGTDFTATQGALHDSSVVAIHARVAWMLYRWYKLLDVRRIPSDTRGGGAVHSGRR